MDYQMHFLEFLSFLQKHGLAYAISTNFFPYTKNVDYHMQCRVIYFPFPKYMVYHMQFPKFLSFPQRRELSYAISGTSFPSLKHGLSYGISEIYFPSLLEFLSFFQKCGLS